MTSPLNAASSTRRKPLSEDWLATIVGLIIVFVIGVGALGPGAQTVTLKAAPGALVQKTALPLNGWKVSATLSGEKVSPSDAPTRLETGKTYTLVCQNDQIALKPAESSSTAQGAPTGYAVIALINECSREVTLVYRTDPSIPWPLFKLF